MFLVEDYKSCENLSTLLKIVLLKSFFSQDFLFVSRHEFLALISILEVSLEELDSRVV